MQPIPLMVELCAGTAALSLRLHRDGAKPPVSRMGSKSGYASALLRVLGLTPGQRAAAYLWCEPDAGVRLLLHAYRDAALARDAAAIIRSWAAEDPRALWERLRAEGPPRLPDGAVEAGEVARHLCSAYLSYGQRPEAGFRATAGGQWLDTPPDVTTQAERLEVMPHLSAATIAPDARTIDPREVARYAQIVASNRLIHTAWSDAEGRWVNTGDGGATFGGPAFASPPERTAEGLDAAPADLPAVVAPDAREVDPREVARWCNLAHYAHRQGEPESGFSPHLLRDYPATATNHGSRPRTVQVVADRFGVTPALPAIIHPDARTIDPPMLPPGTVVFIDPPYSDVAPMIPPVLAAQFLPLDACGREEGDAALRASGLDHLREPVAHLRMAVFEVLRAAGVQVEVLDSVVERVVIDVVDDLVWSQFASDVALHDKTVLANAPAVAHEEPVPILNPALALAGAADSRLGLDLRGDLRNFALRCQAQPGAAAKFSQAVAWAGCALSGCRTPCAREGGSADLAGDLERHCLLRVRVRLDTNTHLRLPGRKTTGYAHDLPRAEVVTLARRWAAAGATVAISEAEPIPELVAEGWYSVDITNQRAGQKRTFSKQQHEHVTLNRPPAWVPPVQGRLF